MKERRPRTPDEVQAIKLMACVRYPVASWDKRFMRHLSEVEGITEKEAPQLWRLFVRYRRQMNLAHYGHLLTYAMIQSAPDLRKLEKARKEQAEIDEMKRKYEEGLK